MPRHCTRSACWGRNAHACGLLQAPRREPRCARVARTTCRCRCAAPSQASCRFCQQHADAQDECSDLIDICPLLATSSKMCGAGPEAAWMQTVCQLSCGACVVGGGGALAY